MGGPLRLSGAWRTFCVRRRAHPGEPGTGVVFVGASTRPPNTIHTPKSPTVRLERFPAELCDGTTYFVSHLLVLHSVTFGEAQLSFDHTTLPH